ncbi:MAG: phospholipase [Micavibrio sp.]|nr:phospholipase [Micavibrio sp.]
MSDKTMICLYTCGGGMRGLIPALIMQRIEERTGLAMTDMVDIFAGPSTGAILNAALNIPHPYQPDRPKYKARHLVRFYEREGIRIFPRDAFRDFRGLIHDFNNRLMKIGTLNKLLSHGHYDPANLGRNLRALYGKAPLSRSLKSLIIPVYGIDRKNLKAEQLEGESEAALVHDKATHFQDGGHALWFKNLKFRDKEVSPVSDVAIYDAIMASCAAPTYFPCHSFEAQLRGHKTEITGIDGSIFDNVCTTYMGALRHTLPKDTNLIMIVLGTGRSNRRISKADWNKFGSLGVVDPANDLPLINIFFHAAETALFEAFAEEMGDNFHILNKSLVSGAYKEDFPSTQLDDASPESMRRMKNFAEMMVAENYSTFETVCDLLVNNHKKKAGKKKKILDYLGID